MYPWPSVRGHVQLFLLLYDVIVAETDNTMCRHNVRFPIHFGDVQQYNLLAKFWTMWILVHLPPIHTCYPFPVIRHQFVDLVAKNALHLALKVSFSGGFVSSMTTSSLWGQYPMSSQCEIPIFEMSIVHIQMWPLHWDHSYTKWSEVNHPPAPKKSDLIKHCFSETFWWWSPNISKSP